MEKLSMCRICLAEELQLHPILNTYLKEIYESLTLKPFEIQDGRPLGACSICCARLRDSYRLRKTCLRSEELFSQVLSSGGLNPPRLTQDVSNSLRVTAVVNLSVGGALTESRGMEIKEEAPDLLEDVVVGVGAADGVGDGPHSDNNGRLYEEDAWARDEDMPLFIVNTDLHGAAANGVGPRLESCLDTTAFEKVHSSKPEEVIPQVTVKTEPQDVEARVADEQTSDSSIQLFKSSHLSWLEDVPLNGMPDQLQDVKTSAPIFEDLGPPTQSETTVEVTSWKQDLDKLTSNLDFLNSDVKPSPGNHLRGNNTPRVYTRTVKKTKTYACDACQEGFCTKSDLLKHVFHVHPVKHNDVSTNIKDSSFSALDLSRIDTNTGVTYAHYAKLIQCHVCFKPFDNHFKLDTHMRQEHADAKRYHCQECNETFIHQNSFYSHFLQVHNDDKPFKCHICQKCFRVNGQLLSHMRTHSNIRPFKCSYCDKSYKDNRSCTRHMLNVHTFEQITIWRGPCEHPF